MGRIVGWVWGPTGVSVYVGRGGCGRDPNGAGTRTTEVALGTVGATVLCPCGAGRNVTTV